MTERTTLVRNVAVNAGLPYATYLLLSYQGVPTVPALAAGAVFPVGAIAAGFIRERRVQALGVIVLVATLASVLAALYFTSPFLALAKGSLFSALFSALLLASLLARRPLVFHLATMGQDTTERQHSEALWNAEAGYRRMMRHITLAWAAAFIVEGSLRLALIPLLPIAIFLPASEAMSLGCIALMAAWSWRYGSRQMARIDLTPD